MYDVSICSFFTAYGFSLWYFVAAADADKTPPPKELPAQLRSVKVEKLPAASVYHGETKEESAALSNDVTGSCYNNYCAPYSVTGIHDIFTRCFSDLSL